MTLPTFEEINSRLTALVTQQPECDSCQVVFVPAEPGATYVVQMALRGRTRRTKDARQFLRSALREIRKGQRFLMLRAFTVEVSQDIETMEFVAAGYAQVWGAEAQGEVIRPHRVTEWSLPGLKALN